MLVKRSIAFVGLAMQVAAVCAAQSVQTSPQPEGRAAARQILEPKLRHIRSGTEREWSTFPQEAEAARLELAFDASMNASEKTLLIRQQDVKQVWQVVLNDRKLGELVRDENDMVLTFPVSPDQLIDGTNRLKVELTSSSKGGSDDIRIGEIVLVDCPVDKLLNQAQLDIEVIDADSNQLVPCRLTILNEDGAMQTVGAQLNDHLAVRQGTVFSSTGRAALGVPAGRYKIFAGRGFEYSLAQIDVDVVAGQAAKKRMIIRREVPTEGYVACDTHIHTLTHSGHGDATIEDRMITLAGEGIELPVATDHNKHIDFDPVARQLHVRQYLTPVRGNEVTTPRGHFNIFPIAADALVVNSKQTDWALLFQSIRQTPDVQAIILNHARDLHSGVRPFGPDHHNALVGENLDGWPLEFNAMEVINSGATQTEPLRLIYDWLGLLNRGLTITPVGSSDSHDVARHFVGQGRTYIRCDDQDAANINVDTAVSNFVAGRVLVSYGLLVDMNVEQEHRTGDLVKQFEGKDARVNVRVLGPHWVGASRVQLLMNGAVIREASIGDVQADSLPRGVKWKGGWTIPLPSHDVHLVAVATGPRIDSFYWRTAKPYQPLSPDWEGATIACTGAIWLDIDKDGERTSPRDYAQRLVDAAGKNWPELVDKLSKYDEAVAAHVAHLVSQSQPSQFGALLDASRQASAATRSGFQAYRDAARESEIARAQR